MNVLYVSTRQWNPGDEFIRAGVETLLDAAGLARQAEVVYNRHPGVRSFFEPLNFWKQSRSTSPLVSGLDFALQVAQYDNSFKRSTELSVFDAVVFCGTPEWFGGRVRRLYHELRDYSGEVWFLGIGTPNRRIALTDLEVGILRRSLVTCRNESLIGMLAEHDVEASYLPCPALLAVPETRPVPKKLETVGLVFTTKSSVRNQAIDEHRYRHQVDWYETILDAYERVRIICHYVDDFDDACRLFGREHVYYSYEPRAYAEIVRPCDYVVSTRVHGCGIASSLGVPNALIAHDARASTADGFLSRIVTDASRNPLQLLDQESGSLEESARDLARHKSATRDRYLELLRPALSRLGRTTPSGPSPSRA